MPIEVPYNEFVYSKSEIDALLNIKADKVAGAVGNNIASLTASEGNLLDSGYDICDLSIGAVIDAGTF